MSRLVIGPSLEEQETEARWQLEQTRSNPKPWRGSEPENTRQTLLLSGLDCLPGQQDLFPTDAEEKTG
jgi:hypothetical protein